MTDLSKLKINRDEEKATSGRKGRRILRRVIYLLILVALVLAALMLFQGPLKPAKTVQVTNVTTVQPTQAISTLNASGYVVAQRKADVASKATGRLEQLLVEEGSRVKKGQVIGEIENGDMKAALENALADVKVAEATVAESKSDFERKKRLWEEKLAPRSDYDVAEAAYNRAVANLDAAKARVKTAQVNLNNTYIRAPFDGTVLTKDADVGDIVAPFGSAGNSKGSVVSMADMNSLQVEADVSESNIQSIKLNQPVEITLDAIPDKRYQGVVHMIVPTADRSKATVMTKIRFLNKDDRVLPEMSAKVTFLSKEMSEHEMNARPKSALDPAAVLNKNGKEFVFLVQADNTAVEKPVTLGGKLGNLVEVVSGVQTGDQLVLNPPKDLQSGMKVKVGE
jgi:RND family efflux transporter MFP subunit